MVESKGFIKILKNEIDEKFKEDSMWSIMQSLGKVILIMILAILGISPNKIDACVNSDNTLIIILVSISNSIEKNAVLNIIFYGVIILGMFFYVFKMLIKIRNYNRKINIFTFFSLGSTQFIADKNLSKKHEITKYELDLSEEMDSIKKHEEIYTVVSKQDREIKKYIKENKDADSIFGFAGIGHTPLIFRAGYKGGDENYFNLFHKYRNAEEFKFLKKIDNSSLYESLEVSKSAVDNNSEEIIVILETTFEVKNHELNLLNPNNKNIIRFSLENKGFDVINNRTQIDEYVTLINTEIREFVKDNKIKLVHMALSTSAAMTFALGMSMSNNYDVKTIVYHYEKGYPWGIDIFNNSRDCVVIT